MKLTEMPLAQICIHVAEAVAKEVEIVTDITEDVLAFTIDIAEQFPSSAPTLLCKVIADPLSSTLCHGTAATLFGLFAAADADRRYEFAPETTVEQQRMDVVGSCYELARLVLSALGNRDRAIFKVKFGNHSFVLVARNGEAELLQSYTDNYTLGTNLKNNLPYSAMEIETVLIAMAGRDPDAHQLQQRHFGAILDDDLPNVIFAFERAMLAQDCEILRRLRARLEKNLRLYKSVVIERNAGVNR